MPPIPIHWVVLGALILLAMFSLGIMATWKPGHS